MYKQIAALKALNQEAAWNPASQNSDSLSNPALAVLRNQAGILTTEAHQQEKNSQIIRVEMKASQQAVNLASFGSNFFGRNVLMNDLQYYVSRVQINGLIPNITENSNFMMTVKNLVFYHPTSGKTYVVNSSIADDPSTAGWTFVASKWSSFVMGEAGDYLTSVEVLRNVQRQLEDICSSNISTSDKVFDSNDSAKHMLAEVFKTTEIQYDTPNGKLMFVQKTKTMQNYFAYPPYSLLDVDTRVPNLASFSKQSLFIASFDIQVLMPTEHSTRLARQLGLRMKVSTNAFWSYSDIVGQHQVQHLANFLLTSLWSVDEQGVIDPITSTSSSDLLEVYIPFHLPSNMFWTTSLKVVTTLSTNSWESSQGKSNVLYVATLDKTGQQTDTVEVRNDQAILHSTSLDSLKSFQLFLYDDYDQLLTNVSKVVIEIVVLLK